MFYSKDEPADFNTDHFQSFKLKAKLLRNAIQDEVNGIVRNTTIAVPWICLSNFWRSLKMPLINCKVEFKLKWTNRCVLSATGADNADANSNNIIFTMFM